MFFINFNQIPIVYAKKTGHLFDSLTETMRTTITKSKTEKLLSSPACLGSYYQGLVQNKPAVALHAVLLVSCRQCQLHVRLGQHVPAHSSVNQKYHSQPVSNQLASFALKPSAGCQDFKPRAILGDRSIPIQLDTREQGQNPQEPIGKCNHVTVNRKFIPKSDSHWSLWQTRNELHSVLAFLP